MMNSEKINELMETPNEYLKGESKDVLIVVNGEEVLINPKLKHSERMDLFNAIDDARYKHTFTVDKGKIVNSEFKKIESDNKTYNCSYCKDEGWIHTNGGLTDSPCPMNCKQKKESH